MPAQLLLPPTLPALCASHRALRRTLLPGTAPGRRTEPQRSAPEACLQEVGPSELWASRLGPSLDSGSWWTDCAEAKRGTGFTRSGTCTCRRRAALCEPTSSCRQLLSCMRAFKSKFITLAVA